MSEDLIKRLRAGVVSDRDFVDTNLALKSGINRYVIVAKQAADMIEAQAREIFHLKNTDLNFKIKTLESKLDAAEKEIEEWKDSAINGGNAGYLREQLAAAQAQIVKYREALQRMHDVSSEDEWTLPGVPELLAQPTNTEALDELIRRAKIDVLRSVTAGYETSKVFGNVCKTIAKLERGKK